MIYFERKKYERLIKLTKEKLDKIQETIHNFYSGIDIVVRNMRELSNGKFTTTHTYKDMNKIFRMILFNSWNDKYYFEKVLEQIGITKLTMSAYFHGFLNTYFFEQKERNLIEILKEYTLILKNLNNEPVKFICWHCKEEAHFIEKNTEDPTKCPICKHHNMHVEFDNIKYCKKQELSNY